jgi:tetratricopeptide (TPR) repeat protein/predicted Ser/Thr protein kinase
MNAGSSQHEPIDEDLRRRFEMAGLHGQPLAIEDCLPPCGADAWLPTLEELVHIELEFAWKAWAEKVRDRPQAAACIPPPPPPRVEHYLARFPVLNQPEILARLIDQEFFVREQVGDLPQWDEYRRRFGELAALGLTGDTLLHQAATQVIDQETARLSPLAVNAPRRSDLPRLFGNYELLEEVGRGGMGVVYRARQRSADRIVALKMVRADHLSCLPPPLRTSALERFRHEALAAARLEHEHIITVYEVGEAEGERFFSMRYVEGQSLADMLCHGPLDGRRAAAYLEPVARAVATAHEAGILHRDLKPQNILVDAKTDRAMIADFGLAKLLEQSPELTRAGDIMGTPAYMSPEQAYDSAKVTIRSDIYSLGATLYHTLAARPPFQAATSLETLQQLHKEEPTRPSLVNPAIDPDLETICLTCLHKEPGRRYATAAALAEDLRRYLAGLPILARPISWPERVTRWCGRNPLLAGAVGLAGLFFCIALVATTVGYATTAAALRDKTQALTDKSLALEESLRSDRHSREVVNQFFTLVSEDVLLDQPGMQPLRNELLQLALAHYQRFLAARGAEPALLEEIARTHYRVALITQAIDPAAAAPLDSLREALRIQRNLAVRSPSEPLDEALGDTLNALGQVHDRRGDSESALAMFNEARELRQQLVNRHPDHAEFRRKLANTIMNTGLIHKSMLHFDEAAQHLEEAQSIRRKWSDGRDMEAANALELLLWRDLAMGHYNLANLAVSKKRSAAVAHADLTQAIDLLEKIERIAPNDLRSRERLAACYHLSARVSLEQRDEAESSQRYLQAISKLEGLHQNSPQVVQFQERLALVQMDYGTFLLRSGDSQAALAAFSSARDHLRRIVPPPDSTEHPDRRRNYAVALREQARVQLELNQPAAAGPPLALSQQYLERLIEQVQDASSRQRLEDDLKATTRLRQQLDML